jgi:hypothetical protein
MFKNKLRFVEIIVKMAPYNPPNTHYSEVDVSQYTSEYMFDLMGKSSYKMTSILGCDYLWYDEKRKVIEVWAPFHILRNGATRMLSNMIVPTEYF